MNKNIYEVLDDLRAAKNKKDRIEVIRKNLSKTLVDVLVMTYHPFYQWKYDKMPEKYKKPDSLPGISFASLSTEIRRLYLFGVNSSLPEKRSEELFLQLLESLEPREAEVVIGIFQKDLGVKGLNLSFVKELFPGMFDGVSGG
jgi:hypothetical protein